MKVLSYTFEIGAILSPSMLTNEILNNKPYHYYIINSPLKSLSLSKKSAYIKRRLRKQFPKRTARKASLYSSRKKNLPTIRRLHLPTLPVLTT